MAHAPPLPRRAALRAIASWGSELAPLGGDAAELDVPVAELGEVRVAGVWSFGGSRGASCRGGKGFRRFVEQHAFEC